ncbi:MAG: heavy-metal-associated domain-containing protein [Thermomicrobiales bacterium]|nr:heavy-metal-associated domain-containing protein [Thermomicrobiales bacterium]
MAETLERALFFAPGINCGHCEHKIRRSFGSLGGVVDLQVSNVTKTVVVDFEPEVVSIDAIRAALADAGYPAETGISLASTSM